MKTITTTFKKENLKTGMLVTLRNGKQYIVLLGTPYVTSLTTGNVKQGADETITSDVLMGVEDSKFIDLAKYDDDCHYFKANGKANTKRDIVTIVLQDVAYKGAYGDRFTSEFYTTIWKEETQLILERSDIFVPAKGSASCISERAYSCIKNGKNYFPWNDELYRVESAQKYVGMDANGNIDITNVIYDADFYLSKFTIDDYNDAKEGKE